jgi:hypothetical protein
VKASIRKMSQREAGVCAARIVSLFHEHARDMHGALATRIPQASAQVVPLFAAEG